MTINVVNTEPDPEEICELCGEIGRITLSPSPKQEQAGVSKVQICHDCLNDHPEAQVLEDYVALARIRDIHRYHEYRGALLTGDKATREAIANARPKPADAPVETPTDPAEFLRGARWEIVQLDDD